jgi:hypothetical protein
LVAAAAAQPIGETRGELLAPAWHRLVENDDALSQDQLNIPHAGDGDIASNVLPGLRLVGGDRISSTTSGFAKQLIAGFLTGAGDCQTGHAHVGLTPHLRRQAWFGSDAALRAPFGEMVADQPGGSAWIKPCGGAAGAAARGVQSVPADRRHQVFPKQSWSVAGSRRLSGALPDGGRTLGGPGGLPGRLAIDVTRRIG